MLSINMSENTFLKLDGTTLKLFGDFRLPNLAALTFSDLNGLNEVVSEVDCSRIEMADSSCLALLIYVQIHNQNNTFIHHFPKNLIPLIKLYDLEDVLHFSD